MKSLKQVAAGMGTPRNVPQADPYKGGYFTKHGFFRYDEIGQENYDSNGEMYIQFPISIHPTLGPQYRDIPSHKVDEHFRKTGGQS